MKKIIKVISLTTMLLLIFNTVCFAAAVAPEPGITPDTFIGTKHVSVAWVPTDDYGNAIMIQPVKNGPIYSRIMYLSRAEAIALNEGYNDSEFKSQFNKVMDYIIRTGSYAGSYVVASKIVEVANVLKCAKVVKFFSGVGGAVAIGFAVDEVINLVRDVDYKALKAEIDKTNQDCWVQIKVGIAYTPTITVPIKEYKAWNSNKFYGMAGYHGQWIGAYADPVAPPSWLLN